VAGKKEEKMAKKNRIFWVQEELRRREMRKKIWKFALGFLFLIGFSPLLATVIVGWLIPLNPGKLISDFVVDWPLILGGLVVSFLFALALKYLRL